MKVKIVGIGKCGSRLTYDFFAYITQTTPAYDLREYPVSKLGEYLTSRVPTIRSLNTWWKEIDLKIQKTKQDMFGEFLLYDPVEFVAVDSDVENNEITGWIQLINQDGQRLVCPVTSYPLARHKGGCNVHIISDSICRQWNIPHDIVSTEEVDFMVTAFSIGGGTGGGAGPIVSHKAKQYRLEKQVIETEQMHFMGVGVLPNSSESYYGEYHPDPVPSEIYNTGRFFSNLYGRRNRANPNVHLDGVWLFSNDSLQVASFNNRTKSERLNLSSLNLYFAASLTTICNASSRRTKSQPNFDPSEMTSNLNGHPFMSGYATLPAEKSSDEVMITNSAKNIIRLALNNMSVGQDSRLYGLSIPVKASELEEVNRILNEKGHEKFKENLSTYDLSKAPIEFRTASTIVMIYGQPQPTHSPTKDNLVYDTISALFPNSNVESYYYKMSSSDDDKLLVLIVNPFINFIKNSIYYYVDSSWTDGVSDDELDALLDDLIRQKQFNPTKFKEILQEKEILIDDGAVGMNIVEMVENTLDEPEYLDSEYIINTFEYLHRIYHHQKKRIRTGLI